MSYIVLLINDKRKLLFWLAVPNYGSSVGKIASVYILKLIMP